jgi:hypothetical protein
VLPLDIQRVRVAFSSIAVFCTHRVLLAIASAAIRTPRPGSAPRFPRPDPFRLNLICVNR